MATAPPRAPMPDLIDVEEFFADPRFANPSISPDGTRIAYLAPHEGRRQVWVRGVDEDHCEAARVTRDTRRGITSYHWTDDPHWLLYLQDVDGNEDWHLYRIDLDGGPNRARGRQAHAERRPRGAGPHRRGARRRRSAPATPRRARAVRGGDAAEHPLPDALHPDGPTHRLMGERFAAHLRDRPA